MSLPPGFLDELRNRISLTQVVGRKVMWDQRKSNAAKGDMWAPCPFHQEKSASFHVDDRKGFYYCFGCHAKGDAIGFVKDTENVGFMEAVEILAREAGMPMPARDPREAERSDRRSQLSEVMEQAVRHFRLQLQGNGAGEARAYLAKRGLSSETQERFGIGFAPDLRHGLLRALLDKGVPEELIVATGMAIRPEDGRGSYDRFRGRIMFPIRDARGRCIAFGGRAMDPQAKAKYLNSPETELFDKGRTLYNLGPARTAAGKGQPLIVAEGYMDVIALAQGGFEAAVAPLGTAVTADQLALMWRVVPEPVIALDGDKAGIRAAERLIDLSLPLLGAERSLRFALLPGGQDPDDLIRSGGATAMQAVLDKARPLIDLLWQRETEDQVFDSPERRAALDRRLRELISKIADPGLRNHYEQAIRDLRATLFRGSRPQRGDTDGRRPWPRRDLPVQPRAETRASPLASATDSLLVEQIRELAILAVCLLCPQVIRSFEPELANLVMSDAANAALLDALLHRDPGDPEALVAEVTAELGPGAVERVLGSPHVRVMPVCKNRGNLDIAMSTMMESLAKLTSERGLRQEIADAVEDLAQGQDEYVTFRLAQAAEARNRAERANVEKDAAFDVAENGTRLDREERAAFQRLLDGLGMKKPGEKR